MAATRTGPRNKGAMVRSSRVHEQNLEKNLRKGAPHPTPHLVVHPHLAVTGVPLSATAWEWWWCRGCRDPGGSR